MSGSTFSTCCVHICIVSDTNYLITMIKCNILTASVCVEYRSVFEHNPPSYLLAVSIQLRKSEYAKTKFNPETQATDIGIRHRHHWAQ